MLLTDPFLPKEGIFILGGFGLFFVEFDIIIAEKVLDDIHMYAVAYMQEGLVVDPDRPAIDLIFKVPHVESQVEVIRARLHTAHYPVFIKEGPAALTAKPGCTQFEPHYLLIMDQVACKHTLDREPWCFNLAGGCPFNIIGRAVVLEIREFRKGEAEPAKEFSLL